MACFGILALALGTSGCATYRAKGIPRTPVPAETPLQVQKTGLIFGVDLPEDGAEIESIFCRDLLAYNVVPLQINLVNRSAEFDYQVNPGSVTLTFEDGRELRQIGFDDVYDSAYFSQWRSLPAWLLILPGFISSSSISKANAQMLRDYKRKEQHESVRLNAKTQSDGVRKYLYFTSDDPIELDTLRNRGRARLVAQKSKEGKFLEDITLDVIIKPTGR